MSKIKYQTCNAIYNYSDAMVRVDLSTIIENVINSLKIENDRLKEENNTSIITNERVEEENEDLRKACKLLKAEDIEQLKENQELKDVIKQYKTKQNIYYYDELMKTREYLKREDAENDRLKAELKQTNKDYNHDCKLHEELSDKQHDIILKLEEDIKEKEKQYHMLASSKGVDNGNL